MGQKGSVLWCIPPTTPALVVISVLAVLVSDLSMPGRARTNSGTQNLPGLAELDSSEHGTGMRSFTPGLNYIFYNHKSSTEVNVNSILSHNW